MVEYLMVQVLELNDCKRECRYYNVCFRYALNPGSTEIRYKTTVFYTMELLHVKL